MSKKRVQIDINSEIKNILQQRNISLVDGVSVLVNLYYGLTPSYVPKELIQKVLASGIVNYDYTTKTVDWYVPLFDEQETNFEWVTEWMDLFKAVNPSRRGTKKDCLIRMKRFFTNNPHIRVNQVFQATRQYLATIDNPMYCKMSHKFIYEQDGTSMLLSYASNIEEVIQRRADDII